MQSFLSPARPATALNSEHEIWDLEDFDWRDKPTLADPEDRPRLTLPGQRDPRATPARDARKEPAANTLRRVDEILVTFQKIRGRPTMALMEADSNLERPWRPSPSARLA